MVFHAIRRYNMLKQTGLVTLYVVYGPRLGALGPGDRAFESHYSDQKHAEIVDFSVFFCIKILIFGVVKAAFGVCFDHIYFFDYCGAEFDYMSI